MSGVGYGVAWNIAKERGLGTSLIPPQERAEIAADCKRRYLSGLTIREVLRRTHGARRLGIHTGQVMSAEPAETKPRLCPDSAMRRHRIASERETVEFGHYLAQCRCDRDCDCAATFLTFIGVQIPASVSVVSASDANADLRVPASAEIGVGEATELVPVAAVEKELAEQRERNQRYGKLTPPEPVCPPEPPVLVVDEPLWIAPGAVGELPTTEPAPASHGEPCTLLVPGPRTEGRHCAPEAVPVSEGRHHRQPSPGGPPGLSDDGPTEQFRRVRLGGAW